MEPIALGELGLTIEQFGSYTVGQITALTAGYSRRRDMLEDMFIVYSALPTYQTQLGKKAPSYQKLTAHRKKRQKAVGDIQDVDFWRDVIEEGSNA